MKMRDARLEALIGPQARRVVPLHDLMPRRITRILLVSSLYDSFTFEEEGGLNELLFAEYLELNLRYAPRVERASTGAQALKMLAEEHFDLVISMRRVGDMEVTDFSRRAHAVVPGIPILLLAYNTRELEHLESLRLPDIRRTFVWQGDHRLFVAMIKHVEDQLNVDHDTRVADVQVIILVEDSSRFYSRYLAELYAELVRQTQALMADSINSSQRLLRMRARPKLLLATDFEEALDLYRRYRHHLLGLIVDAVFPRNGRRDEEAGRDLVRIVRAEEPDRPILMQSSDEHNRGFACSANIGFVHKHSPGLLGEVRGFIHAHLGFGDFVFRMPGGAEVARARNLPELVDRLLEVPAESVLYHARRNHFSAWLMARTEFDLAYELRAERADDYGSPEELRRHLHRVLIEHREQSLAGVVADFSEESFKASQAFVRIGTGSLGGKGRGLAFMNSIFSSYPVRRHITGTRILVPPTAIVATSIFDAFMEGAGLRPLVLAQRSSDEEIAAAFLAAPFPTAAQEALTLFLRKVRYPLAVRSSSLLEDASSQPFAGVYRTIMIPNNAPDLSQRLQELVTAIKLVYASTYSSDARAYLESTPNRLEEEKMAVVIQRIVGRQHDHYFYPDIGGTARSRDFYPVAGGRPEEGVALAALGLGCKVMDGGRCVRFSPAEPNRLYQFSSVRDHLSHSQREYFALDLGQPGHQPEGSLPTRLPSLASLPIESAEEHGTLYAVGSTWSPENEAVYDGLSRPGVRLVTMAGVLKNDLFPLAESLRFLLAIAEAGLSGPVEIEFAVRLRSHPRELHELGFLQVRPLGSAIGLREFNLGAVPPESTICNSRKALGDGIIEEVTDVVYVRPQSFDRGQTQAVAAEIGQINGRLREAGRRCLLIGQGRWGSADRWLGIPVTWSQISAARCIVETDLPDIVVEPSQGTHFFQNITSLGIGYLTVNFGSGDLVDYDWLDHQPALAESRFVRHLQLPAPLAIFIDGRRGRGVVLKPGSGLHGGEEPINGE